MSRREEPQTALEQWQDPMEMERTKEGSVWCGVVTSGSKPPRVAWGLLLGFLLGTEIPEESSTLACLVAGEGSLVLGMQ